MEVEEEREERWENMDIEDCEGSACVFMLSLVKRSHSTYVIIFAQRLHIYTYVAS